MLSNPINYSSVVRASILILLLGAIFAIGFIEQKYILNFVDSSIPVFLPRQVPNLKSYPSTYAGILAKIMQDPRWLSSLVYSTLYIILSIGFIYIFFRHSRYIMLAFYVYSSLAIIGWLLIVFGNIFHSYQLGYGLAQDIKGLIQSPLVLMVLIPVLKMYEKEKPT